MDCKSIWNNYDAEAQERIEEFAQGFIDFISTCKTERECADFAIRKAEDAGYVSLERAIEEKRPLLPGDKVWAHTHHKALVLIHLGKKPLEEGLNILGAHIDSPRLDIKQNPLYESNEFALLDTHYYGGIKKYQWVTTPLAIHGVIVKKSGEVVPVVIGEDESDPVFCVTDLLVHLSAKQLDKKAGLVVEGEDLDLLVGSRPLAKRDKDPKESAPADAARKEEAAAIEKGKEQETSLAELAEKEPVKAMILQLLQERYGIDEQDFLSAELEVVPAGRARDCGLDRSMVLGYGQDDRVCAYPSLYAQLAVENPEKTTVCLLVDKEEIGSVGATGMTSRFFENALAEVMALRGDDPTLALRRALSRSHMLSSDVSAGFDPLYASVFEPKNAAYLGRGLVFNKYTGSRGKSGSNDANAEYVACLRAIMDENDVAFQTAELGRVDEGGGGTIAYILAEYGMNVIDSGVAVLSMHSPWEVSSKADIFEAYKGYKAFLRNA